MAVTAIPSVLTPEEPKKKKDIMPEERPESYIQPEAPQDELRNALVESQRGEVKSADDLISDWTRQRDEEVGRLTQKAEDTKKASIFAGAAEAAAAITNLVGTMAGGESQQIQSVQPGLQARVQDAINRRDASLKEYNTTLSSLRSKRGALQAQQTLALAKFDKDRKNQELSEQRLQIQNATAEARNEYYQAQQLALQAKGTSMQAKLEADARIAEAKFNNLVREGERLSAQTRKYNAEAVEQEGKNKKHGYTSILDEVNQSK